MMANELWDTLLRFHREITVPDIVEIVDSRTDGLRATIASLRNEMLTHFDAVYQRLDRLESEYQALSAAVARLEQRMTIVEQKLDRMALRSEILALKEQVATLEERIAALEREI